MEDYLVGIDFGACNLKAAAFDGKKIRVLQLNSDASGIKYSPNFIYYNKKKDGGIENIIGQVALNRAKTNTSANERNFVANVKRKLEIQNWSQKITNLDREVDTQEVISDIFGCIKKYFKAKKDQQIKAILTVPVCFSKIQRDLIKNAAENAGINVDSMISEPFAALFSLKNLTNYKDKPIVIFDFGGSTLDVSVIKIECPADGEMKITELAAAGIRLGGLDIDRDIYEKILLRNFQDIFDNSMQSTINREEYFLDFAREMKESLFKSGDEKVEADGLAGYIPQGLENVVLKRSDVDKLLTESDYKEKIFDMFEALFEDLADADEPYYVEDISKVLPFGGTCKIPFFAKLLEEYFGENIFNKDDLNLDDYEILIKGLDDRYLAVAGGAVEYLNNKVNGSKIETVNVIPFCIGYEQNGKFIRGIARNMPFGFETRSILLPLKELEKSGWTLSIYQCFNNQREMKLDEENSSAVFIGKVKLDESLYEKKESPVFIMRIMRDGRLRIQFKDNQTFEDGSKELNVTEEHFLEIGG